MRSKTRRIWGLRLWLLLMLSSLLPLLAQTGWQDPSQNQGDFEAPHQAYHDAGGAAVADYGESHQYWGYGFDIPYGALIEGIEVRLDAWRVPAADWAIFYVELSWDGGISWTSTGYNTGYLSTEEVTYVLGGPNDTWGRTWTASELSDPNFRIRITIDAAGPPGVPPGKLDWCPVRIYYTPFSVEVTDNLTDLAIAQSDLDSWFGDPDQTQQSLGSFDVTIAAGINYRVDACYEVNPLPSPAFLGDPLKIENPQGSGNWDYLPLCPSMIQLLGFSGTPGSETQTYPTELDLLRLGDRKAGESYSFTIRVRASET